MALYGIARARALLGEPEEAKAMYRRALDTVRPTKTPRVESMILTSFARLLRERGEPEKALERARAVLLIHEGSDFPRGKADALFEVGLARYETGERAAGVRDAKMAREIYASLESPKEREVEEQLQRWREEGHA